MKLEPSAWDASQPGVHMQEIANSFPAPTQAAIFVESASRPASVLPSDKKIPGHNA